jgi:antitoxin ParD1/3/4
MSVKSSISLTEQQDAFARSLVESGQYSSLSSVLQHGLELLRQKTEAETAELEALRALINRRLKGPRISAEEMDAYIEEMIERNRRAARVDS